MMERMFGFQRAVACTAAIIFFVVCVIAAPAQATMINTADMLEQQSLDLERGKVIRFMERQDISRHLQNWGVTVAEAQARVQTMTDHEVALLSQKIDQMPAGGDVLGVVAAVAVIVFVVLIITDILGVTDVFTFIKKR